MKGAFAAMELPRACRLMVLSRDGHRGGVLSGCWWWLPRQRAPLQSWAAYNRSAPSPSHTLPPHSMPSAPPGLLRAMPPCGVARLWNGHTRPSTLHAQVHGKVPHALHTRETAGTTVCPGLSLCFEHQRGVSPCTPHRPFAVIKPCHRTRATAHL